LQIEDFLDVDAPAPGAKGGAKQHISKKAIHEAYHILSNAFSPVAYSRLVSSYRINDEKCKLAKLFCLACSIADCLDETQEISRHSTGANATVYHRAASQMPVFLVSAAFAERRVANSVKIFIDQWRQLETVLSRADRSILDSFDPASRGAFLYWLLNERALVCVARVIVLGCMLRALRHSLCDGNGFDSCWNSARREATDEQREVLGQFAAEMYCQQSFFFRRASRSDVRRPESPETAARLRRKSSVHIGNFRSQTSLGSAALPPPKEESNGAKCVAEAQRAKRPSLRRPKPSGIGDELSGIGNFGHKNGSQPADRTGGAPLKERGEWDISYATSVGFDTEFVTLTPVQTPSFQVEGMHPSCSHTVDRPFGVARARLMIAKAREVR
jgi:hypothetical protein